MKHLWLRLLLMVTLLICLLVAVLLISSYSTTAAVLLWLLGSIAVKAVKWFAWEKQPQTGIRKLDLLDTEYAAIMATDRTVAGELPFDPNLLVREIVNYRHFSEQSRKDLSLYRLGNYFQLFSSTNAGLVQQKHWKLDDAQRQRVMQFLIEQFGIYL